MTVNVDDVQVGPIVPADGVAVISLDFDPTGWDQDWLEVYGPDGLLAIGDDYTVTNPGALNPSITLVNPGNGVDSYVIRLATPPQRTSDLQLRGEFRSEVFNQEIDRLWQRIQYQFTDMGRALKSAVGTTGLTVGSLTANRFLKVSDDGQSIVDGPLAGDIEGAAAAAQTATDAAAAAAADAQTATDAATDAEAAAQTATAAAQQATAGSIGTRADVSQAYVDALSDGDIFVAGGLAYRKDSALTGTASCMNDIGVDGVTPHGLIEVHHYGVEPGSNDHRVALQTMAANHPAGVFHFVRDGLYRFSATEFNSAVTLVFNQGQAEATVNANGTGSPRQYVRPTGTQAWIFRWISDTANEYLYGGGIRGFPTISGLDTVTNLVLASSVSDFHFEFVARRATFSGLTINTANGVLSKFCRIRMKYTYGSAAAVEASNGLILNGEDTGAGGEGNTQHTIDMNGLVKNGYMVRMVGNCDNDHIVRLLASVNSGTGGALITVNGATRHPRNFDCTYIVGPINISSGSFAQIFNGPSEGVSITGTGQYHLQSLRDYLTGENFSTPTYLTDIQPFLQPGEAYRTGNAALGLSGSQWAAITMNPSGTATARWNWLSSRAHRGQVTGITVHYTMSDANGGNVRYAITAGAYSPGNGVATPDTTDEAFIQAAPAAANNLRQHVLNFATPIPFSRGDMFTLAVERQAGSGTDTATGVLQILGVTVRYRGFGPTNLKTGTVLPVFKPSNGT